MTGKGYCRAVGDHCGHCALWLGDSPGPDAADAADIGVWPICAVGEAQGGPLPGSAAWDPIACADLSAHPLVGRARSLVAPAVAAAAADGLSGYTVGRGGVGRIDVADVAGWRQPERRALTHGADVPPKPCASRVWAEARPEIYVVRGDQLLHTVRPSVPASYDAPLHYATAFCIDPTVPVAYPALMGLLAPSDYAAAKEALSCADVAAVLLGAIGTADTANACA